MSAPSPGTRRLTEMGLIPTQPPITSSMLRTALADPFRFFLRNRLGLVPAFAHSEALTRGSWFAENFRFQHHPNPLPLLNTLLNERLAEIGQLSREFGMGESSRQFAVDRERKDFACALGWYQACLDLPIPGRDHTVRSYFNQSKWRHLGSEVGVRYTDPLFEYPMVGRLDSLYYNEQTNKVWIRDDKTTSFSADARALLVPAEFQPELYCFMVSNLLRIGVLQEKFDLPKDATLGGMIHFAFQKPTIDFGRNDRRYRWVSEGKREKKGGSYDGVHLVIYDLTTGEMESKTPISDVKEAIQELHAVTGKKPSKQYEGEADLNMYVDRCTRWYRAEEEFYDQRDKREREPVVAYSFLSMEWFESRKPHFIQRVKHLVEICTRPPDPSLFVQGPTLGDDFGRASPYAQLYLHPLSQWPQLILNNRLRVVHRYKELHGDIEPLIQEAPSP